MLILHGRSIRHFGRSSHVLTLSDVCAIYKRTTFNFDLHRQPQAYQVITERKGETLTADNSLL
jgi:hypothetical protein